MFLFLKRKGGLPKLVNFLFVTSCHPSCMICLHTVIPSHTPALIWIVCQIPIPLSFIFKVISLVLQIFHRSRTPATTIHKSWKQTENSKNLQYRKDKCPLPIIVGESTVSIRHTMHILFFLNSLTFVIVGIQQFSSQTRRHCFFFSCS